MWHQLPYKIDPFMNCRIYTRGILPIDWKEIYINNVDGKNKVAQ